MSRGRVNKVVVFDFDGTIADTAPIIIKVYNELARAHGWKTMKSSDFQRIRKGTLGDARRWAGIHVWQLPFIIRSGRRLYKLENDRVKLFTGMGELLDKLLKDGYKVYILSRNKRDLIRRVLDRNSVSSKVNVLDNVSFYGGKDRALKKLTRSFGYEPSTVWMVGDETRDIQAANKAGLQSIAVTWGLQDRKLLEKTNPTQIANKPDDVERFLKEAYAKHK